MNNLRGIGLMLFAMAGFATSDAIIKAMTGTFPPGQIILMLGLGGMVFFALLLMRNGKPVWGAWSLNRIVMIRNFIEGFAVVAFVTSLSLVELTLHAAITQASPLIVTLGAALILKEPVGWRRWSAVIFGMFGVLVILRPDTSGISVGALGAVLAAALLAARDVVTRMAPQEAPTEALALYGTASLVLAGALMWMFGPAFVAPRPFEWVALVSASVVASAAYYAITTAMRTGEVSVLIPFRYTRLLFAMAYGILFFGERPDIWLLVGAAMVIGSGLYTIARERKRRTAA